MKYREVPAPAPVRHAVKLAWTLEIDTAPQTAAHVATPDGCMEVIRRVRGRSAWGSEQPDCFAVGVITQPAALDLDPGSLFVGVRIWPWAWNAIGDVAAPNLVNKWAALAEVAPELRLPSDVNAALHVISERVAAFAPDPRHHAILETGSVADLVHSTGCSYRQLQRWFEHQIGIAPRTYLRLLRFSETFSMLSETAESLADHAAAHGFADQAHMAREFRSMAGATPAQTRRASVGPFLDGSR